MVEWLRAWIGENAEYVSIENVLDKAYSLAAEERAGESELVKYEVVYEATGKVTLLSKDGEHKDIPSTVWILLDKGEK